MNSKTKILKTLKDFGRLPSARISSIVGMNYLYFLEKMKELKKQGLVKEYKETVARYWLITDKGLTEVKGI